MLFFCSVVSALAQLKGKVIDNNGLPLEGATIRVVGENLTTVTKTDGAFELSVKTGKTVEVTIIGFLPQKRKYTGSNFDFSMVQDQKGLSEVVVTAFGVKREKKALGYAVSTVNKKDIESRPEGDIGRVLTGKAAGVTITNSSGLSGSGTNIIVRAI